MEYVAPLTRSEGISNWQTPSGKTLEVVPTNALLKIRFVGGGEVPPSLRGSYTSIHRAEAAMLKYLNSFWDLAEEEIEKLRRKKGRKSVAQ